MGGEGSAVVSEGWVVEAVGTEFKLTRDGDSLTYTHTHTQVHSFNCNTHVHIIAEQY